MKLSAQKIILTNKNTGRKITLTKKVYKKGSVKRKSVA